MCDGCIHLPVRASRFSPGACVHPPAIGARSCWCAVGESGEGGEKKREGRRERRAEKGGRGEEKRKRRREKREERRERKRGRNGERGVREHCEGTVVYPSYSPMLA